MVAVAPDGTRESQTMGGPPQQTMEPSRGNFISDETVQVEMSADDWVDEVYYNGRSIRHTVSGVDETVPRLKKFSFAPVPGAVLAIAANDIEPGNSASFYMRCTSTDSSSGWNFQIRPNHPTCKAYGTGGVSGGSGGDHSHVGAMKRPPAFNPPAGWYENDFNDSGWKPPTMQTHQHWSAHHGMSPGVWHDQNKFTFYRIRPPRQAESTGAGSFGPRTDGLISTDDIAGCWVCMCGPFAALFSKEATGPDSIVHKGFCFVGAVPLCPFEEPRLRVQGTNRFKKHDDANNVDQYSDAGTAINGCSCSSKIAPARPYKRMETKNLPGCWLSTLFPIPWVWALYQVKSTGEDKLKDCGVAFICFAIPCPFSENRNRRVRTNKFVHEKDPNNVLTFDSSCFNIGLTNDSKAGLLTLRIC
jgi:hypothetical protein